MASRITAHELIEPKKVINIKTISINNQMVLNPHCRLESLGGALNPLKSFNDNIFEKFFAPAVSASNQTGRGSRNYKILETNSNNRQTRKSYIRSIDIRDNISNKFSNRFHEFLNTEKLEPKFKIKFNKKLIQTKG